MNRLIITHTDSDGWVSGAILFNYLSSKFPQDRIYCKSWNYGNSLDSIYYVIDMFAITDIWMSDLTLPVEFMNTYADRIHHYDHHSSNINSDNFKLWKKTLKEEQSVITLPDFKDVNNNQAEQIAACELLWTKLYPNYKIPCLVHYIGRYDVWNHDERNYTFALNEYLQNFESKEYPKLKWLDSEFKQLLSDDNYCLKCIEEGLVLLKYKKIFNKQNSKKITELKTFNNEYYLLANINTVGSNYFEDIVKEFNDQDIDINYILTFHYNCKKGNWICSCYGLNEANSLDFLKNIYFNSIPDDDQISIGGHDHACGCVFNESAISGFLSFLNRNN